MAEEKKEVEHEIKPEIKQQIRPENYLHTLSDMDKGMFDIEPDNAFILGFGTGFHIFQSMRAEHGNPKMMDVLGNIIGILTNTQFMEAYDKCDLELLDGYWFNFADLTRTFFENIVERLHLLGY